MAGDLVGRGIVGDDGARDVVVEHHVDMARHGPSGLGGEQEGAIARGDEAAAQFGQKLGAEGIVDIGHHQPDQIGALVGKAPGEEIDAISERASRLEHLFARFGRNARAGGEGARNGRPVHAGQPGDVLGGGCAAGPQHIPRHGPAAFSAPRSADRRGRG